METLEGRQSVLAALRAFHRRFQIILIRHDAPAARVDDILEIAAQRGVPVRRVERRELDDLTHGGTHGGIVALCSPKPRMTLEALEEHVDRVRHAPLMLLIEGVDDARNLGFVLRTADALAVDAVLIKKHLWDFDATEIARPASGAYERLPLVQFDEVAALRPLQRRGVRLFGCIAGVKRTIHQADLTGPTILAIGGEKRGLSGALREICDRFVTIPTRGEATSLSLSHAAAIVMAEAWRQRNAVAPDPPA